jgi:hypothetical protein
MVQPSRYGSAFWFWVPAGRKYETPSLELPAPLTGAQKKGTQTVTAPHHVTDESKAKVVALACNAVPQERIAEILQIDPKTLRLHYRAQLDFARDDVGVVAVSNLIRLMRGDGQAAVAACKYFLSCRTGWNEKSSIEVGLEPTIEGGMSAREILKERLEEIRRGMNMNGETADVTSGEAP